MRSILLKVANKILKESQFVTFRKIPEAFLFMKEGKLLLRRKASVKLGTYRRCHTFYDYRQNVDFILKKYYPFFFPLKDLLRSLAMKVNFTSTYYFLFVG